MFSAFNPSKRTHLEQWAADCAAPGEQSWTSCQSRDANPQPWVTSGFKSNALSISPTTAPISPTTAQKALLVQALLFSRLDYCNALLDGFQFMCNQSSTNDSQCSS